MKLSIFAFIAIVFFAFFPSSSFAKSSRTSGHRMDRSSVALILDGDDGELKPKSKKGKKSSSKKSKSSKSKSSKSRK